MTNFTAKKKEKRYFPARYAAWIIPPTGRMDAESRRRSAVALRPGGRMSSYRTFAQQQYLYDLYIKGKGNLAAKPGTSNHGWGLAVDFATHQMRSIVDQIGAAYGWSKTWSDAPGEWWHIRYRPGVWKGQAAPADRVLRLEQPMMHGDDVKHLQKALGGHGLPVPVDGVFGAQTERAVKEFQAKNHLKPDGVVGPRTRQHLHL